MAKNSMIGHVNRQVDLAPAPIDPSWITEGRPIARNAVLSVSEDRTAFTMMWDCTAGQFDWHYEFDETLHVVEGSVIVSSDCTPPKRLQAGDVVFFPSGTTAHWHVETYVRKIAFCRRVWPKPLVFALRLMRWGKAFLKGGKPVGSFKEA